MMADDVIALLGLERHPEGGWYRETWHDAASTAILFLLRHGERSHWHRVHDSAEVWHHYLGDPLRLCMSHDGTSVHEVTLGRELGAQWPQAIVPAGWWQAAELATDSSDAYALVGCTVAPPFRFDAFELAPPGWIPG
jgi:predicted cupin superfamily sugar epimerase